MTLRIAIKVAYFNTHDFAHGFQIQPDVDTIFSFLQKAFIKCQFLEERDEKIDYAGRTDHGVNAICQVIAINLSNKWKTIPDRFLQRINSCLPDNIRCWSCAVVHEDFHPRFDAIDRTYHYIYTKRANDSIDIQLMLEAKNLLVGSHNFINFAKKNTDVDNYIRQIQEILIDEYTGYFIFSLKAKSFLWQQCRRIVAHLIQIGKKQVKIDLTKKLLLNDKSITKPTPLPAENLILSNISYDEAIFTDNISVKLKIMEKLNEEIYETKTKENFLIFLNKMFL